MEDIKYNPEEFANQVSSYSLQDKASCIALLIAMMPITMDDMHDVLDILKETLERQKIK